MSFSVQTPGGYLDLQKTDLDWAFESEPQQQQYGHISPWPRGKMLGGSSSINAMLYVRGDPKGYDVWESMGCPGFVCCLSTSHRAFVGIEFLLRVSRDSSGCLSHCTSTNGVAERCAFH